MPDKRSRDTHPEQPAFVNSPRQILWLMGILSLEAAFMVFLAGLLVFELITTKPLSVASSIGLIVMAVIAAAALVAAVVGMARRQTWTRSFALVWQVLQVAAAVVVLQGDLADVIGWVLAGVSLLGLLLVFSRKVTAWLRPDLDEGR